MSFHFVLPSERLSFMSDKGTTCRSIGKCRSRSSSERIRKCRVDRMRCLSCGRLPNVHRLVCPLKSFLCVLQLSNRFCDLHDILSDASAAEYGCLIFRLAKPTGSFSHYVPFAMELLTGVEHLYVDRDRNIAVPCLEHAEHHS